MFRSYYVVILSLIAFQIIKCDIVEMKNETVNSDWNSNKVTKPVETNVVHSDLSVSASENDTNTTVIGGTASEAVNTSIASPDTPSMSNNASNSHRNESIAEIVSTPVIVEDTPLSTNNTEIPLAADAVDPGVDKQDTTAAGTDDIPTFVEYQQMIEKESKQKREKSDSIPSSPTIILKDNHANKAAVADVVSSHTSGDNLDPSLSSSSKIPDMKEDPDAGHNSRKSEDQKVEFTTSILSKSLLKNNVAAKECGAKILEISGQISHEGFVLNNNQDEYMNVPCSVAEKWFVFETCEPVQIRSIQIANFEMFSSRPKTFKVLIADRYPIKHWYNLGLFRALDEKGIQTFEVTDTRMVKYLKFEMIDHYGNEHYCPLTFVRVMGNVVIDDMDEESEEDQPAIGDKIESVKEMPSKTDSNGLLTKAKDMIAKIVNGIGGSQQKPDGVKIDPIGNELPGTKNESVIVIESPCYFFEFLSRNYRILFQDISLHFSRIVQLEKYLAKDSNKICPINIITQPYPCQIRAEYFALLDFINKTDYVYTRLYQSFLNVSVYCSENCFSHNSLQNISNMFKCRFYQYPSLGRSLPSLPNVSSHATSHEVTVNDSISTVTVPEVITKRVDIDIKNNMRVTPGQFEPAIPGSVEITSTSNYPTVVDDSVLGDVRTTEKTKTDDESSETYNEKKTSPPAKDSKFDGTEHTTTDNHKTMQQKYKSDEVFDNKLFSNPGSNAWNYAFMRIKNIAKELEVNVSISMKYLEELSQNYKQQTDKLKKAQLVMAFNVTQLENMINQHRQETRTFIKDIKIQLQAILFRMKVGMSSDIVRKQSCNSLNLSTMEKSNDNDCLDILAAELTLPAPSFFDSSAFVIVVNISLSLLCNSILLVIFYSKMKSNILRDVTKIMISVNNNESDIVCESIEETPLLMKKRRSLGDLRSLNRGFPVVLPPRGVQITNFPDSDYLSDDGNLPRRHKGFGPFFYPVQPNVNFVTPSKDKKKNKKRK